jgi:ring-1,2-phenylacetyl-CoA epoxidase subunit PaaC
MSSITTLKYTLQLADNVLIMGQRLAAWCGKGPILEQDIALTNISLDQIGQARSLYQYAAQIINNMPAADKAHLFNAPLLQEKINNQHTITEDDLAYLRDAWDFRNCLLVEQENGDWAYTVARSFFFDRFQYLLYTALQKSSDSTLAAIAEKSLKEVQYHIKWASEWVIRLGDGTAISKEKMQQALQGRWEYTGELFVMNAVEQAAMKANIGVDVSSLQQAYQQQIEAIVNEASLQMPTAAWMQTGGKNGVHTEHLGYILAEMQHLQRAYPNMEW